MPLKQVMGKRLNFGITDIIDRVKSSLNYNNELVIIGIEHKEHDNAHKDNWVQIDAFSLILILQGTMNITIDSNSYTVDSKAFIDVFDFHSVRSVNVSSDFKGYHIILAKSFMNEALRNIKRLPTSNFLSRCRHPVMKLEDAQAELLDMIMANIMRNTQRCDHIYQREIIKNEVRNFFVEIFNIIIHRNKPIETGIYNDKQEIIVKFTHLVGNHCKEEHSVGFYAQELCVEPKYLSRILKSLSGKTANRYIDEAIISEARILLKEPDVTIAEVTDMLHFSDQSSFGKFFKKHCGISPLNYRRNPT